MLRLKDTRHQNTASFLDSAIHIAEYYGFTPLDNFPGASYSPSAEKRRIPSAAECEAEMSFARRDERALVAVAKRCLSRARGTEPLFLWRVAIGSTRERSNVPSAALELHVVGTGGAVAEALLIVVADAIAAEAGIARRTLSINNIGSPDSSNRYVRDVGLYLRKHLESISPTLRPRVSIDPIGALVQLVERGHPAAPRAPQSMEYLTEEERRRFWELLEYLEIFGLPYELNPHVLGSRDCWAHSLYELSALDEESGVRILFASGGRYDPLAARFAPVPAAMISIICEVRGRTRVKPGVRPKPALYFAHLGPEARRRALRLLEMLRVAKIPVYQSLCLERIGEQMDSARNFAVPHILIMGHKEAIEGTVLVREVATNSQDVVLLQELVPYLRKHKIAVST